MVSLRQESGVSQFPSRHVIHNVQIVVWYNVAELIAAEKNSFKQESEELEVALRTRQHCFLHVKLTYMYAKAPLTETHFFHVLLSF